MENNTATETTVNSIRVKIGNTTYIVCVMQSETAKKPVDKMFHDLCRQVVMKELKAS